MLSPTWIIQQVVPPALVSYFGWSLYLCVGEIGPQYIGKHLGYPLLGAFYWLTALASIPSIAILFLRLYFLPQNQSVPPRDPPADIASGRVIFECLSPNEAEAVRLANGSDPADPSPLVNRCWKGRCGGRWKPARARHCTDCGVCRAGFDHHCAFFANCLTAPHLPAFLALITLTPPTIFLLSSPLYLPLARRAILAYNQPDSLGWYAWPWSWIIAGGPVGRYVTGTIIGWRALDRADGGGGVRVELGALVGIGSVLGLVTGALALATISLVNQGHLTIDRERARSLARARTAIDSLRRRGQPVPSETMTTMERWIDRHYFWLPSADPSPTTTTTAMTMTDELGREGQWKGTIIELEGDVRPYDRGRTGNWELVMGRGWGWLLPWQALRRGMGKEEVMNWPLPPGIEARLRDRAGVELMTGTEDGQSGES